MILGRQSGLGKGLGALIPQKGAASSIAPPLHPQQAASESVEETTKTYPPVVETPSVALSNAPSGSHEAGTALQIPIEQIDPNPDQPREHFDHQHLEDLIGSIKEQGIIQPLIVTRLPSGRYQLIAGERRLRAAGIAGLETVPAVVREVDDQKRLAWAIIENVQRQDLNPIEEAKAYSRLMDEFHLTQEEVAVKMGKSRPYIANTTRLLQLPDAIQRALVEGKISSSHARTLLSLPSDEERMKLFQNMLEGNFTVRQVEERVPHTRHATTKDPNILAAEDHLREKLHCKVRIQHTAKGGGEIRLTYYSQEELESLLRKLGTAS